jgi:cobalt-zinc-cadmium efflux system protein
VSPDQNHDVNNYNRSFAIGVVLNVLFVGVEAGYGIYADSLALIADAGHNLSDVLSLLLAWGANVLAAKAATERRTYGFRKATVMASLVSAILLLIALGGITWEAVGRLLNPEPVKGCTVILIAVVGVVINTLTALLFLKGQKEDLNIRAAFLHMAADAAVSAGVVVAGILIMLKGWPWIDPVVSLIIVVVIFIGTWALLRESLNYAIDAVPKSVDVSGIRQYLISLDNVERIHDLHVWPLSTTEIALTVHIVVTDKAIDNQLLMDLRNHLNNHFRIGHTTIQVEAHSAENGCRLDRGHCRSNKLSNQAGDWT